MCVFFAHLNLDSNVHCVYPCIVALKKRNYNNDSMKKENQNQATSLYAFCVERSAFADAAAVFFLFLIFEFCFCEWIINIDEYAMSIFGKIKFKCIHAIATHV